MTHKSEALRTILPQKKGNDSLSSVVVLPDGLEFETQNPQEQVFLMLRQHAITNFGSVVSTVIWMIIPPLLVLFINAFNIDINAFIEIKASYIFAAFLTWYTIGITKIFMDFLDWYFNIYVITNERILDFDFNAFAYHKISEASLANIVDATQETIGFFPMLFNYGDVYVQTAGERREFDFHSVPEPAWTRDKIMDLRDLFVSKPKK